MNSVTQAKYSIPRFIRLASALLDLTTIFAINCWIFIFFSYHTLEFIKDNSIAEDFKNFINIQNLQLLIVSLLCNYLYLFLYPGIFKGSVGMRFFKVKILQKDLKECSFFRMQLYVILSLFNIPTLFLGYLPLIFLGRRTLTEVITKTLVVKE